MGHGHVTPNADGSLARCGGPALCTICMAELAFYKGEPEPASKSATQSGRSGMTSERMIEIRHELMLAAERGDARAVAKWFDDHVLEVCSTVVLDQQQESRYFKSFAHVREKYIVPSLYRKIAEHLEENRVGSLETDIKVSTSPDLHRTELRVWVIGDRKK